jgi:hypothetical protein
MQREKKNKGRKKERKKGDSDVATGMDYGGRFVSGVVGVYTVVV